MTNSTRKALYLFLTSILGILLLLMLHRSLFVIYDILGSFFPDNLFFTADPRVVFNVDFFTMLITIFLGGWYGIWLGLDWYKMIYEEREGREWFHGFLPHHWRGYHARKHSTPSHHSSNQPEIETKSTGTVPKQMVAKGPVASSRRIESFSSFRRTPTDTAWSFDDVTAPKVETIKPKRKTVTKKRVVKKKTTK